MKARFYLTELALMLLLAAVVQSEAATFTVSNTADNGAGSLRAALSGATNGDIIDATGVSGTILLTNGDLLITNSIEIKGPGPLILSINGNFPQTTNRVFSIRFGPTVSISGLTITNGRTSNGGGVLSVGSFLTISNCVVRGNTATAGGGGGILSIAFGASGSLAIFDSIISDNSADVAGGIYSSEGSVTLTMMNSIVRSNSAGGAGGGGIKNQGGTGGGNAKAFITNCTIIGNTGGYGGGVLNDPASGSASIFIVNSALIGNSAAAGGPGGGGFNNYSLGGGSAKVTVINSTLSGNSSGSSAGAIANSLTASSSNDPDVTLLGCTLSGNSAQSFGGGIVTTRPLVIGNTIINAGASGSNFSGNASSVTSMGYNMSSDSANGFLTHATDQTNINPLLGPLQDNGGPVLTHALLSGSPAMDAGKNFSGSTTDARGSARTFDDLLIANAQGGDGTDIGAYEFFELRITAVQKTGNDLLLSFTSMAGSNYEIQSRTDLTSVIWSVVPGTIPGNGGTAQATVKNAFGTPQPQQFFRIHRIQ